MSPAVRVAGWGYGLPERVVSSAELEQSLGLDAGWIESRTGIRERRFCSSAHDVIELAAASAQGALQVAGITATDLDLVIVSTSTGAWSQPHTAAAVHGAIGMRADAGSWDLNAVCSGFVHALHAGAALLASQPQWNHVLVVGADCYSTITDPDDRKTRVLFGDGAGALVLSRATLDAASEPLLGQLLCGTEFEGHEALIVRQPGAFFEMDGPAVREFGTQRLVEGVRRAAAAESLTVSSLDFVAPHQSNLRMLEAAMEGLELPLAKLLTSVETLGNTASASIPITLARAAEAGSLRTGMRVAIVGYGGGLSWAATILRW